MKLVLLLGITMQIGLVRSFITRGTLSRISEHHRTSFIRNIQEQSLVKKPSQLAMSKSFTTWSFDKPCGSMDWNELVKASLEVVSSPEQANLVLVGVAPPPQDEEEDDEEEDKEEEAGDDEDKKVVLEGRAKEIDEKLGGALSDIMKENSKDFKNGAKAGSTTPTLRVTEHGKATRYVVVGMGKPPKDDDEAAANAFKLGDAIGKKCNAEKKVATCSVILPDSFDVSTSVLKDVSTSMYTALYTDNRYRTGAKIKKAAPDLEKVTLVTSSSSAMDEDSQQALDNGKKIATGVFLTKDIVNAPHNILNSESLAETAKRIAADSNGRIKCTILNKKECESRGMGAYLGVARGSETDPQFIHLTYTPPKKGDNIMKVGVIGKGLLFDTGGYNIKTAMMELMKFDCGGAAAVLGAARATAALSPEGVEAHFIVAACENMINEKAMVPSDVLTAMNGKTIEVVNTDAEGRLTLAELSTLTGACMVSLGKQICGVWTDDDELAKELDEVSKATGDKSWRMPMAKEYNDQLESKIADLSNCGTRYGGAITAALFLQNFVSKKKPFAHIDIAGPVWSDKTGATGFGAKLVAEWVRRQGQD